MKQTTLIHLIVSAIVLTVITVGYVLWLNDIQSLKTKAAMLMGEIEAKSGEQTQTASTRTALIELAEGEALVESKFVPADEIVPFLESLESLGRTYGGDVNVVSVTDPGEDGRMTVALSIDGSFEAVMRTLGVIEHGAYASATKNLTLETLGEGGWSAAFTMIVHTPL